MNVIIYIFLSQPLTEWKYLVTSNMWIVRLHKFFACTFCLHILVQLFFIHLFFLVIVFIIRMLIKVEIYT